MMYGITFYTTVREIPVIQSRDNGNVVQWCLDHGICDVYKISIAFSLKTYSL